MLVAERTLDLAPNCFEEPDPRTRVYAEFREMPGLKITLAQAVRLFGLDRARCEGVLGSLVKGGLLITDGTTYVRRSTGLHYM